MIIVFDRKNDTVNPGAQPPREATVAPEELGFRFSLSSCRSSGFGARLGGNFQFPGGGVRGPVEGFGNRRESEEWIGHPSARVRLKCQRAYLAFASSGRPRHIVRRLTVKG